ncbi:MAG: LamG-like jellyroll fold domain-containing protein, partial [Kofleriaceae bacterium]
DDGKPDLLSISTATAGTMTHLVLVADGAQRILYVNDVAEATGVAAEPSNWDPTYTMSLVDEPQNARQWLGTVGLVAMYNRALTDVEVHQNFAAGSSAP